MRMLSYEELFTNLKKGMRNRNWKRLRFLDKALYRAAMWYVKRGGSIVSCQPYNVVSYIRYALHN
jgi:hypothetical protein